MSDLTDTRGRQRSVVKLVAAEAAAECCELGASVQIPIACAGFTRVGGLASVRDRADRYAVLDRLAKRVQASVSPEATMQVVADVVRHALRVPYVAIEVECDTGGIAAEAGRRTDGIETRMALVHQRRTVGRLVVQATTGCQLPPAAVRLLDDLARHAGAAAHSARQTVELQRSRELMVAVREDERRRLRRDLHDGVGPALAAIALKLDAAHAAVGDGQPACLLSECRDETRETIADIRHLIDELRPPALDELGLVGAIARHAERLSRGAPHRGLTASVNGPELIRLPAVIAVAAYRIALEAMTNVVRHSAAQHCMVTITVNGTLRLTIADDGCGVRAPCVAGVGQLSMRERAEELGGHLEIVPRPGGGTLVVARLPITAAS